MAFRNADDYLQAKHPHLYNGVNPRLVTPHQATLTLADTYYQLTDATWGATLQAGFTLSANGLLNYDGIGQILLFAGVANVTVSIATTLTLGLFVNGSPIVETPRLFDAQNKMGLMADMDFITLVTDDLIDVRVKASDAGVVVDVTEMKLIYK